jgi:hypothetical protein
MSTLPLFWGHIKHEIEVKPDVVEASSATMRYLRGRGPKTSITTSRSVLDCESNGTLPDGVAVSWAQLRSPVFRF